MESLEGKTRWVFLGDWYEEMMLVTILCSVPVSALIQPQVGWKATRFKQSPSLPPQGGCPNFSLFFFFLLSTIFITLTPACLATKDTPGDTKQDLSSMIAQGISGLVRPLLSGLKVSKTHFVYFCKVTEQNCIRSKQVSRRGFSSTCKLQCASGESRWVKSLPMHHCIRKYLFRREMHWTLPWPPQKGAGVKHDL